MEALTREWRKERGSPAWSWAVSWGMARIPIALSNPVLTGPRRFLHTRRRPLGSFVSGLLAIALARRALMTPEAGRLQWISQPMGIPTVDIDDGDQLYRVLDAPVQPGR